MTDEMFDRTYQSGREAMNNGIDEAVRLFLLNMRHSFKRLNALRWQAPWDRQTTARQWRRAGLA